MVLAVGLGIVGAAAAVSAVDNACCYHILHNKINENGQISWIGVRRMTIHVYIQI